MTFSLDMKGTSEERARHYLEHAEKFRLGDLLTEASHPETRKMSDWAKNDLSTALSTLRGLDLSAVQSVLEKSEELEALKKEIQKTIDSGHRVFLSGCGATGRLSLKLEFLWRQMAPEKQKDQVVGFMAGGDVAFIRSIESFEDYFEFGARQLNELGFQDGDLVIGITEGGETSFVIGSVEEALRGGSRSPFFLYCNPSDVLKEKVGRSRRVLDNSEIQSIELAHEPMALSGSTRMQATTVQLLAVAACLLNPDASVADYVNEFVKKLEGQDYNFLEPFIVQESDVYEKGQGVVYSTDEFGMTILTDTTERSPTFSLPAFENFEDKGAPKALCYFHVQGSTTAEESWFQLLSRNPRTLDWEKYHHLAGPRRIQGYDFSDQVFAKRTEQVRFEISRGEQKKIQWSFEGLNHEFDWQHSPLFFQHLMLKLFLNAHSTLIMGRLGRYQGNWMTWVKPSNGKLIDRAIRYIQGLGEEKGLSLSYEDIAHSVFAEMEDLKPDESIVLKVFGRMLAK